jgi:hypothetical protein
MKKRLISILLCLALAFSVSGGAFADYSDFSDSGAHWAQATMERAYNDGFLKGFEDNTIRPNATITPAQMITILCRVLNISVYEDVDTDGVESTNWYAEAAWAARHVGLFDSDVSYNSPMTRLEAFKMLSCAFQLSLPEPDTAAAAAYSDYRDLTGESARIIASLVQQGYIQGYNGSLSLDSTITRAEFMTVLYRIVSSFASAEDASSVESDAVLSGDANLADFGISNSLWLDCSAGEVSLTNVTAPSITVRAESISSLDVTGCSIDRLVIANNRGDLSVAPDSSSAVSTVAVGNGAGAITLGGALSRVETIGSSRSVTVSSNVDAVYVSGSGNTVTVNAGVTVKEIHVSGTGNTVILNSSTPSLTVSGNANTVKGSGSADNLTLISLNSDVQIPCTETDDQRDNGISDLTVTLSAPESLAAGTQLKVTAAFSGIEDALSCSGAWYLDGVKQRSENITVSAAGSSAFTYTFKYTKDMATSCSVRYVVTYTNAIGENQQKSADVTVKLENYDDEYYNQYSVTNVLKTVTSKYAGDYTLNWALNNDYDAKTKTVFVNAKGYSSTSQYLVWISLTYQRVNVFQGSKGNWTLIHEYLCGTGANDCTPRGVWTVFGRTAAGWTTSTYNCRPVVNFKTGSGYAFHSRLYDPTHSYLTDASIGFPVSHGCIRMYDDDVKWLYDNLPIGTTVVVY